MLKGILQRFSDWTGDKRLTEAIHRTLKREGYAVHAAQIREVRLAAIERPGWVQVYKFRVETHRVGGEEKPLVLHGLSRDDGRRSKIEVLLTESLSAWRQHHAEWTEGLLAR